MSSGEEGDDESIFSEKQDTYFYYALQRALENEESESRTYSDYDNTVEGEDSASEDVRSVRIELNTALNGLKWANRSFQNWIDELPLSVQIIIAVVTWLGGNALASSILDLLRNLGGTFGAVALNFVVDVSQISINNSQLVLVIIGISILNSAIRRQRLNTLENQIKDMSTSNRRVETDGGRILEQRDPVEEGSVVFNERDTAESSVQDERNSSEDPQGGPPRNSGTHHGEDNTGGMGGALGGLVTGTAIGLSFGPGGAVAGAFLGLLLGDRLERRAGSWSNNDSGARKS